MTRTGLLLAVTVSAAALVAPGAFAQDNVAPTALERATPKADNTPAANALSPELGEVVLASGMMPLENPSATFSHFGFAADGPLIPAPGAVQQKGKNVEATKTEPDKNTYLVLTGQKGADAAYDYGTHFIFQGHEVGPQDDKGNGKGRLTRVNLDADAAHRVTLMAETDTAGNPVPLIDGSTWNPFAKRLLLTSEMGPKGGVWQASLDVPAKVEPLFGAFGRESYEGVQTDRNGSIWLVADVGGKKGVTNSHAKQPNSFVYRFVPKDKADLSKGGKLEVLQVMTAAGEPIVFANGDMDGDIKSAGMKDIHTYGAKLKTRWVLIHDTDKDGMDSFDANALAKAKQGSPFKRPENGQFRPGSDFNEFYFSETGDTSARTEAGTEYGGFGAVLKLAQADAAADEGTLSLVYRGDVEHTGLDNVAFWTADKVVFVEDAGDDLHSARKAFDSGYLFDLGADYSKQGTQPVRLIALGRDPLATIDSAIGSGEPAGFQNEGDNEITGIHISDGDASEAGLLGAKVPTPFKNGWRVFYTQQHGENTLWEVIAKPSLATN